MGWPLEPDASLLATLLDVRPGTSLAEVQALAGPPTSVTEGRNSRCAVVRRAVYLLRTERPPNGPWPEVVLTLDENWRVLDVTVSDGRVWFVGG